MKFMMNGAITIGTLDGANIEIRDAVGSENFFLFGAQSEQVSAIRAAYNPNQLIAQDENLNRVMALLESGHFNLFEQGLFDDIISAIRSPNDPWIVAYDFASYVEQQQQAALTYLDKNVWTRMSILNTAASGEFSSDRTIQQYSDEIWRLSPM